MTECCEPALKQYRIDPETGELQQSLDGGETWENVPGSIYSAAIEPRPLSGEDGNNKKCEAANNAVDALKDVKTGIASKLELTYTFYDFLIAILVEIVALVLAGITGGTLVGLVVPLIPKIIELGRGIFGLTTADYNAMFTEEVWTTARCIMYCRIGANGKFDAAGWNLVKADLEDQLGSGATQAGANLAAMVDVWALKGLNHAAAIGAGTSGNCDDCDCPGCQATDWLWDETAFGAPAGDFTRDNDTGVVSGSSVPLIGTNYFGVSVADCCSVSLTTDIPDGTWDFRGIIGCDFEGEIPWFNEADPAWIPIPIDFLDTPVKALLLRGTNTFTASLHVSG